MASQQTYTMEEVASHVTQESLWLVIKGKVYDVTEYTDKHPGGANMFLNNAGKDVSTLFDESHSSKIPHFIAQNYEIGILQKESKPASKDIVANPAAAAAGGKEATAGKEDGTGKTDATHSSEYSLTLVQCTLLKKQFSQLAAVSGSVVEAGNLIYDALFVSLGAEVAKRLFKSPKKVVAFRMISQVERFVNHSEEKEFLETELYNMAMRHLAYVTYEEMKKLMSLFISTIVEVIKNALDEYWTDESQAAWYLFLRYIGGHLMKNSLEFGGKVSLLRSSWNQVLDLRKISKGDGADRSGGFGDALFFNLGVMSPEIAALIVRDRAELGQMFEGGFSMMVTFVSDPPVLNEELYVLAARHLEYGTEEHHFPVFGQAVMVTLRSLLPRTWNWAHEDAWGWLWNMASKFMIKSIANGHAHKQRIDDSMVRLEGADMDEIGAQFYAILFETSVEAQAYFYKPNSLVQFIVSKVLKLISTILHSPDETTHNIRALGMRHIKYAIPPDLFPLFGTALTGTLPSFLEGFWDEDIREAWATVFEFVKDCMTRAVISGTNLVTKALVSNNATACLDALTGAPRNERILWQLEVDVSNIKVSPFNWALQDAKFEVARFMLTDILEIRADREAYYYGKDVLFRVHPDLIEILSRLAPQMLNAVFEGLMWHSRNIVNGRRRVNYYISDVYGNPHIEDYEDCFVTPMASLTRLNMAEMFTHPFVLFLLELKWTQFARNMYLTMQLLNVMSLLFFMLGWVILDTSTDIAFGFRCAALGLVVVSLVYFQLRRIAVDIRNWQIVRICFGVYLPFFLTKLTNSMRLVTNVMVVVAFATDVKFFPDDSTTKKISAWAQGIACCGMFALLIETSQLYIPLLKFQHKLGAVSTQFAIYLLCLLFLLVGFSTGLFLSEGKDGHKTSHFDTMWHSILNLYGSTLGLYDFTLDDFSGQMLLIYIVYVIVSVFLLTRLLLAIMCTISIDEDSQVEGFAYLERAELTIELESSCNLTFRKSLWDSMHMDETVEFDAGDLGPAGGIQVEEVVGRQVGKQAADDRITRYPGECDPGKPWPRLTNVSERSTDERLEKLSAIGEKIRRAIVNLQKKGFSGGKGGLPTLSECESNVSAASN